MKKDVSYLIKVVHDGFRAKVDAQLKSSDMTVSQSRVLHFIRDSGGVTTQKKIEEFLEVSHPTVVGLLSRMNKSGYIECGYDEEHGKNKIVRETQKAVDYSKEMENFFERANEKLTEGLSQEEKSELMRLLGVLYENVNKF